MSSSVLRWPDASAVDQAARVWAAELTRQNPGVMAIAYIGSYARGDWGVGSDLDLIVVVRESRKPFWERASELELGGFPVPAEAMVYTSDEWQALADEGGRFFRAVEQESVWLYRALGWEG